MKNFSKGGRIWTKGGRIWTKGGRIWTKGGRIWTKKNQRWKLLTYSSFDPIILTKRYFLNNNQVTIYKSNKLIEASYRLSIGEQRLLLVCIARIRFEGGKKVLKSKEEFNVSVADFINLFPNVPRATAYKQLKDAANNLFEREITIKKSKTRELRTRWVSDVEYNEDLAEVTIGFAPKIVPYLAQLEGSFTKYKLEHLSHLTTVHAMRTYELCIQHVGIKDRAMTVEEYKAFLGLEDNYKDFKDLNKYILKPSIAQINKHTDISVKLFLVRENKKIISLKFIIESKQVRSHKASKQKTESKIKQLSFGINDSLKKQTKQQRPSFVIGESYQ